MEEAIATSQPQAGIAPAFWGKRLHSLTGVVPLGAFLIEHLLTNSLMAQGPEKFNKAVWKIQEIPYLIFLEIGFIFLPLAYHTAYGLYVMTTGRPTVAAHPYPRNLLYTLQRVTGIVALFYIVFHVFSTRFQFNPSTTTDFYTLMADHLNTAGWIQPFYVLGLVSVVFHFCNGLNTFLMTWGLVVSRRSQTFAGFACAGLGFILTVWGLMAIMTE